MMKFLRSLLAVPLLAALVAAPVTPPAAAEPLDTTPRIAVLSAFEPEWTALRAVAQESAVHSAKGVNFITGTLEGKPVVLVLTGISMVNAAMTTQMALDRFNITRIVLSGVAGGVDPSLDIGDVVVPDQWAEYLEAIFARETPQGFELPPGVTTELPNFGMIHPRGVRVFREGQVGAPRQLWFPVDPAMMAVARTAASGIALKNCPADGTCLQHVPKVVVGGNGVSGAAFVDNAAFRTYVFSTFKAQVLDMESAAAAHVAATNGVPFIALRSLSDLAGGGPGANEIRIFEQLAAQNAVTVLRAFIRALPD